MIRALVVWLLLGGGVVAITACCAGVLVMRSAYDRLHYAAAAATVGSAPFLLAVIVHAGLSMVSLKAALLWVVLAATSSLVTQRVGRGLYALEVRRR
jgi:multisubunit Na+/H+ antiporter MnhG subunit